MQRTIDKKASFGLRITSKPQNSKLNREISSTKFFIELLIIVCLSAVAYVTWATLWTKFSRAEVFFAECAREMIATNNLITPLYHAQPFFDKPIFVYWLIIGMFKTLGINHFAARLPSIIASLITIIATALAGAFLFGKRAGLLAAFILASSFMYLSFSSLCMSDMFLVMFDTLSLAAIYAGIIFEKPRTLFWLLAALSMGFAFLTKGPVGILLPVLTSVLYLAITGRLFLIKVKHVFLALAIITIVASPWFYAAYLANGAQSMVHFFIQENLQRFAGSTYDVHKPFWYTVASFFLGFAPWSILIPPALYYFYKNQSKSENKPGDKIKAANISFELKAELYLWIWLFVSVGFFCFSRGKCDYYTMPAFTAAVLLVSHYVDTSLAKFSALIKAVAVTILVATIFFAVFALPKINELIPISKYATMINNGPGDLRIGVDEKAASWIDEILFQSGRDPQRLSNIQQVKEFISKGGPALLIMPENKYNLLSVEQKENYQIVCRDKVSTHPLTPGYLIERAGNIADAVPFVVAVNFPRTK